MTRPLATLCWELTGIIAMYLATFIWLDISTYFGLSTATFAAGAVAICGFAMFNWPPLPKGNS